MMEKLYEYLETNKLNDAPSVYEFLPKLSNKKLNKLIDGIIVRIPPSQYKKRESSLFSFSANSTLAGMPFPCEDIKCRLENVDQLARFASLYSDQVIIPSPFDHYLTCDSINIECLIGDLLILNYLRPLVEQGIICFSTSLFTICKDCLEDFTRREDEFNSNLAIIKQILEDEYLKNIQGLLIWEGKPVIYITGPESYGFHGSLVFSFRDYIPEQISAVLNKKMPVPLSVGMIKEVFLSVLTSPILEDLSIQNVLLDKTGYNYLTHRDIDVQLINALHGEDKVKISNNIISGLVHEIPILANASLDGILKLRNEEGESFKVYRDAVSSILRKADDIGQSQFREAYQDIVLPELDKINLTIANNKKTIISSLKDDLLILGGVISFGLYAGIISPEASKFLTNIGACAVGGGAFLANEFAKVKKLYNEPDAVKENKFYFLWKLQRCNQSSKSYRM